jgi:hypothetical protein
VYLREQRLDPRRVRDALIELERDLRRETKPERTPDARPQMTCDAGKAVERRGSLGIASENAHEHLRVPKVASHIHAGNGDEADDAGILDAFSEEGRYFFSDRFGNAVRATGIVRHRLRNPSLDQRTPRSRTAGRIGRARDAVKNPTASRERESSSAGPWRLPAARRGNQLVLSVCKVRATSSVR